ncbi:hypothetical protein BDZ85DRAFT_260799 [Elsinoe ampelina]|uniref:DUF7728 domain-containing protein n=1 Tax=Elsinoe ampelina TaxID=302913 RepID=A0A6A6GF58_9PEZI|nr:hypothetical protein BDZ85DRAFT_260799 [Elsinoe ampelina]
MVSRLAGVVAATSALTAQALLIPPGMQSTGEPVELMLVKPDWQAIRLPCPECVFPTKQGEVEESAEGETMWIQGGANSLLLNISTIFEGNAVGLEDYALYPPLASFKKAKVDMIRADTSMTELVEGKANRVSVTVTADSSMAKEEIVSPDADSVVRVHYQIMSIDNHPVTVDGIEVTALKRKDGKMALLNAEPIPKANSIFDSLPPAVGDAPTPSAPRPCSLPAPVCHFRDVLEAKLKEVQAKLPTKLQFPKKPGCHGRKGAKTHSGPDGVRLPTHRRPPHFQNSDDPRPPHRPDGHRGKPWMHGRPHHHFGGPYHHHHHGGLHRAAQGILFVLVPIFLGITMGMLVSMIGMIVGRLIAFVWMRFVRGGRRGYASVKLNEDEAEAADKEETESVMSEPLPQYEDAPAYEEKESA